MPLHALTPSAAFLSQSAGCFPHTPSLLPWGNPVLGPTLQALARGTGVGTDCPLLYFLPHTHPCQPNTKRGAMRWGLGQPPPTACSQVENPTTSGSRSTFSWGLA